MLFISNPFMQVDMMCIFEQLSEAFNWNIGELQMEIRMLRRDI